MSSEVKDAKTKLFIKRSIEIHGNRYDYSRAIYINAKTKFILGCPVHGWVLVTPDKHLAGVGCKFCAFEKRSNALRTTPEEFKAKGYLVHLNKYNYERVVYINNITPVEIQCNTCNRWFWQTPNKHLAGSGCAHCSNVAKPTQEEFISRVRDIYGDKLDLSKAVYISGKTKTTFTCKIHNHTYEQIPYGILKGKNGCIFCASVIRSEASRTPQEEFFINAKGIVGDTVDLTEAIYRGYDTKVKLKCLIHNWVYFQAPSKLLNRQVGCELCYGSPGELIVAKILIERGIRFQREVIFEELDNLMKFDFYLPDYNIFIEYHGHQHYRYIEYIHKTIERFEAQKQRDRIKKLFVKDLFGFYLEIPYSENNKQKVEKSLLPVFEHIENIDKSIYHRR